MSIDSSQEIHLLDYFQVILKRKFIVLACLSVTLTTVLIANYITEPIYEGIARIVIDEDLNRSPVTGVSMDYDQYLGLQTHFDLITSYPVLERVYNRLFINEAEGVATTASKEESIPIMKKFLLFIIGNLSKAKHFVLDLLSPGEMKEIPSMSNPDFWTSYEIRGLRGQIKVAQVKNTMLVDLIAENENPELARDFPNAFALSYIEYNRSSSFEATKASIDWLSEQLNDMKKEIRKSEKKFYTFKEKEGIFSIEGKQQISSNKISQLTDAYSDARTQRLTTFATINRLRTILNAKNYDELATISTASVNNPLLENLRRELLSEEAELSALKKTFKFEHPQIIVVEHKIKQSKTQFEQELKRTLTSLQSEHKLLKEKEQSLLATIQQYESEALELNKKEMEYTMLEREVETNKKLYNLLFNNFTEANVIKAMPTTNIRLLEEAAYPLSPIKPRKLLNLTLGIILGLMIGVGLVFFLEYLDRSIETTEDVELYLGLPILSSIPKIPARKW